jgi:phosphate uptake regulator
MSEQGGKTDQEARPIAEVERIRDIIFGPQMRLYEQQFKRMGSHVDLIGKQLTELKATLDEQLTDQGSRIQKLQEDMNQRIRELESAVGSRLDQVESAFEKQDTELAAQTRELTKTLQKQARDIRSEFTTALNALEDEKTSRHNLGDLLVEMGTRLKEQASLSDLLGQLERAVKDQAAD